MLESRHVLFKSRRPSHTSAVSNCCPWIRAQWLALATIDWHYFNWLFVRRFWKVLGVFFPKWSSVTLLLFVSLLCLVLLEQYLVYKIGLIPSEYYRVLGEKNKDGFGRHTIYSLIMVLSMAAVVATKKYTCSLFYITTRRLVTLDLHENYFIDISYYRVNVLDDSIDNVDQRITQDVDKLCNTFSQIIPDLLISPFTIAYYTYKTWVSTGYIGPLCVFLFFVLSSVINKFLMSPVVQLVYKQERMEGDFRYKHTQVRSHSESVAFYRCGKVEKINTDMKLGRLITVQMRLALMRLFLSLSVSFADYFGSILSYIIIAIPIFSGVYDDLSSSDLVALISQNAFVTIYMIYCFTRLIDIAPQVTDMAGTTHRVRQLAEKLKSYDDVLNNDLLSLDQNNRDDDTTGIIQTGQFRRLSADLNSAHGSYAYALTDVSLKQPTATEDKLIVKGLNLKFNAGVNVLITGDSGCGKTSLLRALDNLWHLAKGTIERRLTHGSGGVFYIPQKPYLTDGTLRQQVTFPDIINTTSSVWYPDDTLDDAEIVRYLQQTGLEHLLERSGGLDAPVTWNWYDVLSPGEMQRIAFVRLFHHRPVFAVLDEATSQVSLEMEAKLYNQCQTLNITLISIGHRTSLQRFHSMELHLEDDTIGSWQFRPISSSVSQEPHLNYEPT